MKKFLLVTAALAVLSAPVNAEQPAVQIPDAMLGSWCPVKYQPYDFTGAYARSTDNNSLCMQVTSIGFHFRTGTDCKFTHFLRSPAPVVNVDVLCNGSDIELQLHVYMADNKLVMTQQ